MEVIAQERDERNNSVPRGEVDKIDQSKYSKEANLIGIEPAGLRGHAEFVREPFYGLVERDRKAIRKKPDGKATRSARPMKIIVRP
jgi:hypothetical protein